MAGRIVWPGRDPLSRENKDMTKRAHDKNEVELNSFAIRCFRNTADKDYIAARMCYRAGLISQFHWAALQAFEKYFKAIYLLNRVKAKKIGHNLELALDFMKKLPFKISLSDISEKLIRHLDRFGRFRYLEISYHVYGPKLIELDRAVWELRRYCRVMNHDSKLKNGKKENMLSLELDRNTKAENRPFQEFKLVGGFLEKVINEPNNPARSALIWQNGFYGKSRRKTVNVPNFMYAENSPLSLRPEILDDVIEYVLVPKDVVRAYREILAEKSKSSS